MSTVTNKRPALPRDWKRKVSERLNNKGITLTHHQVYDLAKGRSKDPVLQKAVLAEVKKVGEAHQKQLDAVAKLQAETAFLNN
jgi:dsRNA-specific ribonuclease